MFFKNQKIGKYRIIDAIGSGGFGSVYLAVDELIDMQVAIKVPHKQGEDSEKLLREPKLLAKLKHPNIVSIITAEKINDVFMIVMEYVPGTSLERYLREHGTPPVDLALEWFLKIAEAIRYAHGKHILHRDIRPANVLLSEDGQIKLADLGTSRELVETYAKTRIGSPPYMAPEHFQGKAVFQSDIYSFGVLMYECLTGRLPYFDKDPRRLARLARESQAPAVHELADVPIELSRLVARAMHRNEERRYPRAEDLMLDLKRVRRSLMDQETRELEDEPAEPPTPARPKRHTTITETQVGPQTASRHEPHARPLQPPAPRVRDFSRELSDLFCWNCSKPVQRRTHACPHCGVSLR